MSQLSEILDKWDFYVEIEKSPIYRMLGTHIFWVISLLTIGDFLAFFYLTQHDTA